MITAARKLDWTGWTKTAKPVDRDRPFHRINSPTMKEAELRRPDDTDDTLRKRQDGLRVSGEGVKRGCKIPPDIPFATVTEILLLPKKDIRELVGTTPGWVLVEENNEQLQEVEGVLLRSYQTWTDVPFLQWHRWYDWNFMVFPAPGYGYLRGRANRPAPIGGDERKQGFTRHAVRDFDGVEEIDTMEVEFDCGLFGSRHRAVSGPQSFGPMFESDWAWPQTGSHFWAMGRWIYDCSHPDKSNELRTRSELHPCHAVASARWEAFRFPQNGDTFVPAIQFMFFATRLGGYTDAERPSSKLPRENIDFIVDLPEFGPLPQHSYPIGHTPDIPHNTITIRPALLHDFNFAPFEEATAKTRLPEEKKAVSHRVEPIIKPIVPEEGSGVLPRQVRVTIPLASVPEDDEFYGVIISLGWRDIDQLQQKKVRHFKVTFQRIDVGTNKHGGFLRGSEEWQVRMGVNGRWAQKRQEGIEENTSITLGTKEFEFELHLAEDDAISIAAHGEETDNVHDTFKDKLDKKRELLLPAFVIPIPIPFLPNIDVGGRPIRYFGDCVNGDRLPAVPPGKPRPVAWARKARRIVSAMEDDQFFTFGAENDPLGRIDPFHKITVADRLGRTSNENPIPVAKFPGPGTFVQVGVQSVDAKPMGELAEKPDAADYTLVYKIEEIQLKTPGSIST